MNGMCTSLSTETGTPKGHGCWQGLEASRLVLAMDPRTITAGDASGLGRQDEFSILKAAWCKSIGVSLYGWCHTRSSLLWEGAAPGIRAGTLTGESSLSKTCRNSKEKKKSGGVGKVRGRGKKGKHPVIKTLFWLTDARARDTTGLGASGQQHQTVFIQENQ